MKRFDISGLRKNRTIAMKIGFIFSLSFVILAFNYSVEMPKNIIEKDNNVIKDLEEVEVIRTKHKKQDPPPKLEFKEKFEAVEELTFHEPEPAPISLNIDDEVEPNFNDDGMGNDDPIIEPDVDEEPLDILVEDPPMDFAEYMPSFGNCDVNKLDKQAYKECSDAALLNYFSRNLRYPAMARENNIQGKVILKFVVNENGEVSQPKVLRGVSAGCTEEALRVLKNMPKWKPGRHGGRNVKVYFTLPVSFKLN